MTITAFSTASGRADHPDPGRTRVLWVACGAHALHDGLTDTLYLLLPLWQAQFALSYAAIGLLRALYTGVMAGFQVPAAKFAQRTGARVSLCWLSRSFLEGSARAPSTRSHPASFPRLTREHARAARSVLTTSPGISGRWRCPRSPPA